VSRDGRGVTHVGRPATVPGSGYEPPVEVITTAVGPAVEFTGDDGRNHAFAIGDLPLPGWHTAMAAAFAERVGPTGSRRTLASATVVWDVLRRFVRFLATLPQPPAVPQQLSAADVDTYMRHRVRAVGASWAWQELIDLRLLFGCPPLPNLVSAKVMDYLARRVDKGRLPTKPGYSDGEMARLVAAARADVAAIRDRLDAGERLLAQWSRDPSTLPDDDRQVCRLLAQVAQAGVVPRLGGPIVQERDERTALARRLFVTRADRAPLLVLLAAVTGRNSETLKELPADHRVLDGAAVELCAIKRRHGPRRWFDTVTWEIGPAHRELHTAGGLYLLLHRLMARGRTLSGSQTLWSEWRNGRERAVMGTVGEHRDPYAARLSIGLDFKRWAAGHDLRADPDAEPERAEPMTVELRRVRTTVEVRRTRAVGGHLPSAARSNTVNVLFANYLRGEPTAHEWAEEVLGHAVVDAEQAALAVHRQTLSETGRTSLRVQCTPPPPDTAQDGAWSACADPDQHPATGNPCRLVSFLDCFHCGNCLITRTHLPAILALLDALAERRTRLGETEWWTRYGAVWAAIRRDVLPKFTPAELETASRAKPAEALLELAEDPWEHP
jgi:hypothetical protein